MRRRGRQRIGTTFVTHGLQTAAVQQGVEAFFNAILTVQAARLAIVDQTAIDRQHHPGLPGEAAQGGGK